MDWLREDAERRKREQPVIKTRWFVVEHTPSRRFATGDGHGGTDYEWTHATYKVVSDYFDNVKDAMSWMDRHEADKGKTLEVKFQNLRRKTVDQWVSW
jgi:hypothetical protein